MDVYTPLGAVAGTGRVCVIDVESALDPDASVYLPNGDSPTIRRSCLLRLTAVAALSFELTVDGLADIELASLAGVAEERDLVMVAEQALAWVGPAGTLVTHNGVEHDLPLLRRRAMRTWAFDRTPSVFAWADGVAGEHCDTTLAMGHGSLIDLCAGLGIPAYLPRRGPSSFADDRLRKCELDVAATAVAYLHTCAGRTGSATWLAAAWRDLARYLLGRPVRDHLMPLVRRGIELGDDLAAAGRNS